ncbi:hypothetical protein [Bombilactobacillus thymidiniphilus]|uniref:TetR family transcriptional regulator n=1 Tax=Bombilactobacillus thymidiniphilus TaxID=2923363 RepID=A0ABY4PCU6_9LACO|nr:hypothetical protein [Bombilactobacillus thymidiniphilus]UQS83415.1 hypothetical protein MOO47_06480 [Bombilactobacillus thymidiniphilus]
MVLNITAEYLLYRLDNLLFQQNIKINSLTQFLKYVPVSRSTIYRHFAGGLDELYKQVALRKFTPLLQHNFTSWQQVTSFSVAYVQKHHFGVQSLYHYLTKIDQQLVFTKLIKNMLLQQLVSLESDVFILEFLTGAIWQQWQIWLDSSLQVDQEIIIKRLSTVDLLIKNNLLNEIISKNDSK